MKKVCSLKISLIGMMLLPVLLSATSCTPLLIGQAACQGALVVGTAAASASARVPNEDLKRSIDEFNEALQFKDYSQALAFMVPDKRNAFWPLADRLKQKLDIAKYEVRDLELDKTKRNATVSLYVEYWRPECPIVKGVSLKQKWQYSEKDKKWEVGVTGFEAFP